MFQRAQAFCTNPGNTTRFHREGFVAKRDQSYNSFRPAMSPSIRAGAVI